MPNYLLTGAGFSYNWGGWLAKEAFEYLLGCPEIDDDLRYRLWQSKKRDAGFEDALANLQQEYNHSKTPTISRQLATLTSALAGMFNAMGQAFMRTQFESNTDSRYSVKSFLARFHAIFTLNQDTLLEQHYLHHVVGRGQWSAARSPGIKPLNTSQPTGLPLDRIALMQPDTPSLDGNPRIQPYFKLHGSHNWTTKSGLLLITGSNKETDICRVPLRRTE